VTSPRSFLADPGKRLAAGAFDFFAVFLTFLAVSGFAEASGSDWGTFRVFCLVALTYHFLCLILMHGQTLGKRAQGICVVTSGGEAVSWWRALLRALSRYLPLILLTIEYREWEVAEALTGLGLRAAVGLFCIGEVALLQRPPARQSLADRIAGTLVVNTPEVQPHRAPAIPMYSANDAEFGYPPQRKPGDGPRGEA
jgi:uncharacterized RDD family membrane protein YckC